MAKVKLKAKSKAATDAAYAKRKSSENDRQRRASQEARDIGALPKVKNPKRRKRCAGSLLEFCRTYFSRKFYLPFSPDHLTVIDRLERCVRGGGLFSVAMPRGAGKSALAKAAAVWAVLYGYRRFVMLIAATDKLAEHLMNDIKQSLAGNDLLAADFPEACFPVWCLENITHRAKGQLLNGKSTNLGWKQEEVRLATIAGMACSGAIIRTAGLTGAIRGANAPGPDGETLRPDLALIDDPSTRESAGSLTQNDDREAIIRGDVLGLAGPDVTISAVMTLTVIYPNDLADRFLDPEKCPQWNPVRTALVRSFPTNVELWEVYLQLRADSLRSGGDGREATELYGQKREAMDAGAAVSWPERFDKTRYLSALEEAMCRRQDNPAEFAAEYQNQPETDGPGGITKELVAGDVAKKLNRVPRCEVPRDATRLVAMIDVHAKVLFFAITAWDEKFNGAVIDYGTFPRQNRSYFSVRTANPALANHFPGFSEPQLVFAGLRALTAELLEKTYTRQDIGDPVRIELCMVDAGWQTDAVHQFCRQSQHAAILLPSQGYATTSNTRAMDDWTGRPNERVGRCWRMSAPAAGRGKALLFDPDFWKSHVADRLLTPPGGAGCLQLFGDNPAAHQMFADHCTAEYATRIQARGREFDKWSVRPDHRENHLFDAVVGTAVAASVQGLVWSPGAAVGQVLPRKEPRKKIRLSDVFAAKHGGKR